MGDMNDPKQVEETVRRAFEAAVFDERTSDEAGFAAVFESFKPRLLESIDFNVRVREARLKRRRAVLIVSALILFAGFPAFALLNLGSVRMVGITFYGLTSAAVACYVWAFRKRASEEDPNQTAMLEAVLARFGCGLGHDAASHDPIRRGSPLIPVHSRMDIPPDDVHGRFDDRIDFDAIRVKTVMKSGKSSYETFRGWYLRIDLPFTLAGTTIVRERAGTWDPRSGVEGLQQVHLEDPDFTGRFVVSATDQVEARVILPPDVIRHLADAETDPESGGGLGLAFTGSSAHIWLPSHATQLADWQPLNPSKMIQDLHEAFAELSKIRGFLRDIDLIAESEGFRAQASRQAPSVGTP